jgi:hypothetical protein
MSNKPNTNFNQKSKPIYELFEQSLCSEISFWDITGYFIFGVFVAIFLWVLFFKLNGITIFKLPFNYQMGGINNIYSSEYLKIGE